MLRFFRDILKGWNAKRNTADAGGGVREDVVAEPAIHIHEDDWGMRNLYPVEASLHAADDIAKSADAGERNRAPDGVPIAALERRAHIGGRVADALEAVEDETIAVDVTLGDFPVVCA